MKQRQESAASGGAGARKDLFLFTLLAWLVPGAGHWMLGLRRRAVAYSAAVLGLFIGGALLGSIAVVSATSYAFLLQLCTGPVSAILAYITYLTGPEHNPTRMGDIGLTMTLIAGALNVLLMADVLDRANGGPFESEKPKPTLTKRLWLRILGRRK